MPRKVFFSFDFDKDHWRVSQVRNVDALGPFTKAKFLDRAPWEAIRRQGDVAIKRWIDQNMHGASVTVVLIGARTAERKWVQYEIRESISKGMGLLGIDISKIRDQHRMTSSAGRNPLPRGYPIYKWINDNGRVNIGRWVEKAARDAGR